MVHGSALPAVHVCAAAVLAVVFAAAPVDIVRQLARNRHGHLCGGLRVCRRHPLPRHRASQTDHHQWCQRQLALFSGTSTLPSSVLFNVSLLFFQVLVLLLLLSLLLLCGGCSEDCIDGEQPQFVDGPVCARLPILKHTYHTAR